MRTKLFCQGLKKPTSARSCERAEIGLFLRAPNRRAVSSDSLHAVRRVRSCACSRAPRVPPSDRCRPPEFHGLKSRLFHALLHEPNRLMQEGASPSCLFLMAGQGHQAAHADNERQQGEHSVKHRFFHVVCLRKCHRRTSHPCRRTGRKRGFRSLQNRCGRSLRSRLRRGAHPL